MHTHIGDVNLYLYLWKMQINMTDTCSLVYLYLSHFIIYIYIFTFMLYAYKNTSVLMCFPQEPFGPWGRDLVPVSLCWHLSVASTNEGFPFKYSTVIKTVKSNIGAMLSSRALVCILPAALAAAIVSWCQLYCLKQHKLSLQWGCLVPGSSGCQNWILHTGSGESCQLQAFPCILVSVLGLRTQKPLVSWSQSLSLTFSPNPPFDKDFHHHNYSSPKQPHWISHLMSIHLNTSAKPLCLWKWHIHISLEEDVMFIRPLFR